MATQKVVRYVTVSDLSGAQNARLVQFSYAGKRYEIDLTSPERRALESLVAATAVYGRKVPGDPRVPRAQRQRERAQIRAWGREHGWKVGDRGYVPKALVAAYEAAEH